MKGLFGITNKTTQSSLKDLQEILIGKTLSQAVIQMQVSVLDKTVLNSKSNFVLNETILFDSMDLPWTAEKLKG